jgi:hypothetical protein
MSMFRAVFAASLAGVFSASCWAAPAPKVALPTAKGTFAGVPAVAQLRPNADGSLALEIWSDAGDFRQLIARAPKAGCMACSGPDQKPNPASLEFVDGTLHVGYEGGGAGLGRWAWRSSWGWDRSTRSARPVATQRLGSDAEGAPIHALVDFISGERRERSASAPAPVACRAALVKTPAFQDLALKGLFDGSLEPGCLRGAESGKPLAAPPPQGGALDNLMRASSKS